MSSTKKANVMLVLCSAMALFNAALSVIAPEGGDFFVVGAVLWGVGAVLYCFVDFDGRGRR